MARVNTQKRIAEKAGVSVAAVSQILNNSQSNFCSEETKRRVRAAAKELGYQVNFGYRLMRGQKTHTVAILNSMQQMNSEEYILRLIMMLIKRFDNLGYSAYCSAFTRNAEANVAKVQTLINRGVEHFVFLGAPFGHFEIIEALDRARLPYIANNNQFPRWVDKGVRLGSTALFNYLKGQVGQDRIKLICQPKEAGPGNQRLCGFHNAMPGLSLDDVIDRFVFFSDDIDIEVDDYGEASYPVAYDATRRLLGRHPDVGAIVYMNDNFAMGGARFILEKGNERFRGILLAGNNNEYAVRNFHAPITSVSFNLDALADALVENALKDGPCHIQTYPTLHIRRPGGDGYPDWTETAVSLEPKGT